MRINDKEIRDWYKYLNRIFEQGQYTYLRIFDELKIVNYINQTKWSIEKFVKEHEDLQLLDKALSLKTDTILEFYSIFKKLIFFDNYIDSIHITSKTIKEQANNGCKDVRTTFSRIYKGIPFSRRFYSFAELKEYNQTISEFVEDQERCMEFIKTRQKILSTNDSLEVAYSSYKDIVKAYKQYYEQVDLSWNKGITKDKLQPVIETQQRLAKFVVARNKIASNHSIILQKSKNAPYIKKVYVNFMKNSDLYWTSTVTAEKLSSVIDMQEKFIIGLDNPNLKTINKNCNKKKINDMTEIINLLLN